VDTVRSGDPFLTVNARRLTVIAWCLLGIQLLDLLFGAVALSVTGDDSPLSGWTFNITGWIAVLLLFGAFLLLIYLATGRGVYVALGLVALAVGGFVGYRLGFGVFETRVDMWLSPWQNGHKRGDHLALSLWGLASGGPFGSGLGMGAPGTIPRGALYADDLFYRGLENGGWTQGFPKQLAVTESLVRRGQVRFNIYCAPCHGYDGRGAGHQTSPGRHSQLIGSVMSRSRVAGVVSTMM